MLRELIDIYRQSRTNPGAPECTFAETLLFNEGWLLRGVLQEWQRRAPPARFDFVPFPQKATVYSEAQLYTPFKARFQGDQQAEAHTHVDGIVGDVQLVAKSGMTLTPGWRYLAVFEAKMYSPLSSGVKHAPGYDQVSRTAACMIHAILESGNAASRAHLVVLYPADNAKIQPGQYTPEYVEARIADRVGSYLARGKHAQPQARFFAEWRAVLPRIQIQFLTWEEVLAGIADDTLNQFYDLCIQFNRKAQVDATLDG
jgi:hypothetical protein